MLNEIVQYLKSCETFYIATMEENQPRVRPFGCATLFEGKLYISTTNQKKVYNQIKNNPKVEICGMYNDTWIRVEGEVVEDTRREARVALMEEYTESLGNMYSVDDNLMTVLHFTHGIATIYSFTAEPKVITF